jgi:hypothetical protein
MSALQPPLGPSQHRRRARRSSEITVTWLMRALGECRRTMQYYLRLLEGEGYIREFFDCHTKSVHEFTTRAG